MMQEISVEDWLARVPPLDRAILIDVRDIDEFEGGTIPGALHVPLEGLLNRIERVVPDHKTPIVTFCRSGRRSREACQRLAFVGYEQTFSLRGGLEAYKAVVVP